MWLLKWFVGICSQKWFRSALCWVLGTQCCPGLWVWWGASPSMPALHPGAVQLALPLLCCAGAKAPSSSDGAMLGLCVPGTAKLSSAGHLSDLSVGVCFLKWPDWWFFFFLEKLVAYQREFHALKERLRIAEHRTLQRSSELNAILEQFRRAVAETNGSKNAMNNFSGMHSWDIVYNSAMPISLLITTE